jgi:hypothetical protein
VAFGGHLVVSISICHEIGLVHLAINLTGLVRPGVSSSLARVQEAAAAAAAVVARRAGLGR